MANTQAPFTITVEGASAIGAQMLIVVCGDEHAAMVVVAYAFLGAAVFIAYAHHRGRPSPTAYMILAALAAVWKSLAAPPTPTTPAA